jgi:hypothetical protein
MGTARSTPASNSFEFRNVEEVERVPPRVQPVIDLPPPTHGQTEPDLVAAHQQNMPEGPGAVVEERKQLPWLIAVFATTVLVAGAIIIGVRFGWIAGIVGIVWLLLGFAVSWSVVWGAGLLRARDEEIVEEKIEQGEMPPPPGRRD